MKKLHLLKRTLLLLALIVGCVNYGWAAEETITLTYSSFGLTTSYAEKTATVGGIGFTVNQGYKGTGNVIQMNSSKGSGILYNTTAISGLKSVKVNVSSGNKTYTITTGTSQKPTGNSQTGTTGGTYSAAEGDTYFQLKVSGASYFSSIEITYETAAPTTCATPTFSPATGAVAYGTEIAISSSTDGATIYYTIDGTTPTKTSTEYDAENKPTITAATTINAIAVKDGLDNSEVGSADYTIQAPAAPTFSINGGMVSKGETVTLSSAVGTTIRYTTDGSVPSASVGTIYSSSITINENQTIKAVAYDAGGNCSTVASYDFTVFEGTVVTFDATKDTGTSPLTKNGVEFSCTNGLLNNESEYRLYKNSETTFSVENGKIVRIEFTGVSGNPASGFGDQSGWETDGDDGTWTGTASSVSFTASGAQVRATKIAVYVNVTATPVFSVAEGEYSEAKNVAITCATDGATIYYTTDGSTPTSSSTTYSSAILVTESMPLKAIAIKDGVESAVATATYTMIRPAAPTFDVAEGVFDAAFDLHLATETADATIYYTTDGSTPTTSSSEYSDKVAISAATTTVKAIAVKNGLTSDVASVTYTYDARITPDFTLSTTSVALKVNDTSDAVTLTTNSDGTIAFTCADAHVTLTGTGNSRTIMANAAGVYTVNVSVTGSATYKDADGVITVTVTKKATTMAIETEFSEGKDLRTASEGLIEGTVKYNESALSPQPTVTYTSSNPSVATVAADGVITFKKAGTTTITASFAGNDEYEECEANYELTLIDTTPQATSVNITFGNALYGTSFTGANAAGDGPVSGTVKNVSVEADQGTAQNFFINDSETRIYNGGTVTISAPTGYYLTKIVVTTSSNWSVSASPGTLSSATWTGSAQEVVFSASARSDFKTATVTLAPTVTISAVGWATFSSDYALDFTDVEGLEAYMITGHDGVNIVKSQVTGTVPANTGLLLKGDADTYSIPVVASSSTDVSANKMVAGTGEAVSAEDGKTKYVLGVNGSTGKAEFQKIVSTSATVPAGKAYLQFNEVINARALQFDEGETTSLREMKNEELGMKNAEFFNLNGQRVAQPTKGLYIVNGRKVVIR